MNRYLLPLALASCTPEYEVKCPEETHALEDACDRADVRGTHENKELYDALGRFKMCTEQVYSVRCSDDGWQNILKVTEK